MKFGFDCQAISEKMFESNGHIHVFSHRTGAYFCFDKHNYSVNLVLCCKFSSLNDFVTVFPIQTYRRLNSTLQ